MRAKKIKKKNTMKKSREKSGKDEKKNQQQENGVELLPWSQADYLSLRKKQNLSFSSSNALHRL